MRCMPILRAISVVVFVALSLPAFALDIRFGYGDHDVSPYFLGNGPELPEKPGLSVELVRDCTIAVGAKPVFIRLPVRRLHEEVRAGQLDAMLGLTFTPERTEYLAYPMQDGKPDASRRGATISYMLYRLRGNPVAWNGKSITGLNGPLGVNSGFVMANTLRARGVDVEEVQYDRQLFPMLERGRVGAVATLENIGDYYIERSNSSGRIEKLQPPLATGDYYIATSRQFFEANGPLVNRFWDCLARERERLYAALASKYLD